jgi:hypothetical protein
VIYEYGNASDAGHMPCIWPNTVNTIVRTATRSRLALKPRSTTFACSSFSASRLFGSRDTNHPEQRLDVLHTWSRSFSAQTASNSSPEGDLTAQAASLSDCQLSRAAAQAVRLSFTESDWESAFYLLKSMHSASHPQSYDNKQSRSKLFPPSFVPITFGRPINYRLSAHALVHALLRVDMPRKAADVTHWMMKHGVRVRSLTLEATIKAQLPQFSDASRRHQVSMPDPARINDGTRVLRLRSKMVSHLSTRFAISLLLQARRSRQQRTQKIWDWLIHTCLLQGEVIVGTLLFTILVKDFALKRQLASQLLAQQQRTAAAQDSPPHDPVVVQEMESEYRSYGEVFPHKKLLQSLASAVDDILSRDPPPDSHLVSGALQALANLAWLLDHRKISFPEIAPLIRAMYRCPRLENEVWIYDADNKAIRMGIHAYCHSVLKGLINDLPRNPMSRHRSSDVGRSTPHLPSLDLDAYNSLLHYALRHRLSPALANRVLTHMMEERHKPLQPDIATFNILIRSGTLLKKNGLSEKVLEALRRCKENQQHAIRVVPRMEWQEEEQAGVESASEPPIIPFSHSPYSQSLHQLYREEVSLHDALVTLTRPLLADSHTLTTYITHLTSTNRAHVIPDILFHLLPELFIIDHPSYSMRAPEERLRMRVRGRERSLRRAVLYGPWIFCALLNALRKAGQTGLAERVWLLAKEAERASWLPQFWSESPSDAAGGPDVDMHRVATDDDVIGKAGKQGATGPWCLPVHAYTTMLQCYASESFKGLSLRRRFRAFVQIRDSPDWTPRIERRQIRGWAKWFLLQKEHNKKSQERGTRTYMSKHMGIELVRAMRQASMDVYESLLEIQRRSQEVRLHRKHLYIPRPDARFFNAALSLYTRQPSVYARSRRATPSRWQRRSRLAERAYAMEGRVSQYWHPWLREIVVDLVEAGFEVPVGVRWTAVGRGIQGISGARGRATLERTPFAFPKMKGQGRFRPHALKTLKERGMPRVEERKHRWPSRRGRYRPAVIIVH